MGNKERNIEDWVDLLIDLINDQGAVVDKKTGIIKYRSSMDAGSPLSAYIGMDIEDILMEWENACHSEDWPYDAFIENQSY